MFASLKVQKAVRWLAFALVVVGCGAALIRLPPHQAQIGFALVTVSALGVAGAARRDAVIPFVWVHRARLLGLLAVGQMALSAYWLRPTARGIVHYRPTPGPRAFFDPYAPYALAGGALALALALRLAGRRVPAFPRPAIPRLLPPVPRYAYVLLVPGMLLLYAVSEANGGLAGVEALRRLRPAVQLALLLGGIGLVAVGLGGIGVWQAGYEPVPAGARRAARREGPFKKLLKLLPTPLPTAWRGTSQAAPVLHRDTVGEAGAGHRPAPTKGADSVGVGFKPAQAQPVRQPHHRAGEGPGMGAWQTVSEIALVALLTLGALGVRMWELGDRVRVMVDEGHFAMGVTYFWAFPDVRLLEPMPTAASFPFIFSYGQAGMVDLFGRGFFGLRAFSALLGGLTIPAVYLLGRQLYDRRTALLAALILLTFPPHLHYSRLALNNIADPLFGTLGLAFLARGLRSNRRTDYALGGVMLGLTHYFYEGGRLLFVPLAFGWLIGGWIAWRPRPSVRGILLAALACVLVALPVYYTLVGLDFALVDRLDKTRINSDEYWDREREPNTVETRLVHFRHSLLMYVNQPENTLVYYYLYYGGTHPLILEYFVPVFLLGAVIALWRWRAPGVLPVLWVLATSAGNAMLVESAVTARYVVAFPALALLMAVGIRYTLALVWPAALSIRWRDALMITLALAVVVVQGYFYYGPFLDRFEVEVRAHVDQDVEDALLRSLDFPPGTEIHVIGRKILPQLDAQRFLNFMADGLTVKMWTPETITLDGIRALSRLHDNAFFFAPGDVYTLSVLATVFGPLQPQPTPHDLPPGKGFLLVYIPADPTAEPPGAVG